MTSRAGQCPGVVVVVDGVNRDSLPLFCPACDAEWEKTGKAPVLTRVGDERVCEHYEALDSFEIFVHRARANPHP
jgi:hypothetical protein